MATGIFVCGARSGGVSVSAMTSRPVDFESLAVAFRTEIALHPPTVAGYLATVEKAKARSGQREARLSLVQEAALFRIYRKASGIEDWTKLDKIG